jgi:hypothetical protein
VLGREEEGGYLIALDIFHYSYLVNPNPYLLLHIPPATPRCLRPKENNKPLST